MSIRLSSLPAVQRSASQPVIASPSFATRQGFQFPGVASPGVPRVAAAYAAPRAAAPSVYAGAPVYAGSGRAPVPQYTSPSVYSGAPSSNLTYAAPPTWGGGFAREEFIVEPNGQVDRVYAMPPTLTYAAPVQQVVEIVRNDTEVVALRYELQESVALVQEYQRKNGELVQYRNDLEMRLSSCEVRGSELQQENNSQREEINMLLRRNEELMSLNLSLQEKVRELEAHKPKPQPVHHAPVHHAPAKTDGIIDHNPPPLAEGSDDDKIEKVIRDFIRAHPDFPIEVERTKPLWYQFSGPIHKKVNFKVVGHNVLARVGGGFDEALKWLTEQRKEFIEAEGIELEEERENSGHGAKGRQLGSRVKRSSSGGRNSVSSGYGR